LPNKGKEGRERERQADTDRKREEARRAIPTQAKCVDRKRHAVQDRQELYHDISHLLGRRGGEKRVVRGEGEG